uniref:Uncharacterized protein n=1 Tax=uncultured prokaryote TaxID=198431 RepID=A0A0H5Q3V1_9ZZZZ|nr:hypothetical protein [uncultured prokaryote]
MGYPRHLYLTFGGRYFTDEIWSGGIRLASPASPNDEGDEAWTITAAEQNQYAADAVETWFTSAGAKVSGMARLDWVKLNAIDTDGSYLDKSNTNLVEYPTDTAPTGGSGAMDWPQISVCVSFRTDVSRGLAARGRLYVPAVVSKSGAGRVGAADCLTMATAAKDLLEELRDMPQLLIGGQLAPCVVSRGLRTGPDTWGPGVARYIRRSEVGDVADTQRRRRNELVEVYSGVDVDPDD